MSESKYNDYDGETDIGSGYKQRGEGSSGMEEESKYGGNDDDGATSNIAEQVSEFFYEDDDLSETMAAFVMANTKPYQRALEEAGEGAATVEWSTECYGVYREYVEMMETTLEGFVEMHGYSMQSFIAELADVQGDRDDYETGENLATAISCMVKYEVRGCEERKARGGCEERKTRGGCDERSVEALRFPR